MNLPASPNTHASAKAYGNVNGTGLRWAALAEAGTAVAALAGIEPENPDRRVRNFPALLRECHGWRRDAAVSGIEDLSAIVEAGLAALLAINARGGDCRAAAQALWQEFSSARAALVNLLPPATELGPMRSA